MVCDWLARCSSKKWWVYVMVHKCVQKINFATARSKSLFMIHTTLCFKRTGKNAVEWAGKAELRKGNSWQQVEHIKLAHYRFNRVYLRQLLSLTEGTLESHREDLNFCINDAPLQQSNQQSDNIWRISTYILYNWLTCRRHLIRSPGAMITVVKTPASIPALNSWKYLSKRKTTTQKVKSVCSLFFYSTD